MGVYDSLSAFQLCAPVLGMSLHLFRRLSAVNRASACLRLPVRQLYSTQAAVLLRPDVQHDEPAPTKENAPTANGDASRKRKSRVSKKNKESESEASGSQSRRNPLEPTRVDMYLASLQSEGVEPTLDDLEKCRPARHPHRNSAKYAEKYNELADTLCRSFSRAQLQKFVQQCGLDRDWKRRTRRKLDFAEAIIEGKWGWPSLEEVERAKRDRTEVVTESMCRLSSP